MIKGNDGVVYCTYTDQGTFSAVSAYNAGQSTPITLNTSDPSVGLSDITVTMVNGYLMCSFSRLKYDSSVTNYFPTDQPYYLLFASGFVSGGRFLTHLNKKVEKFLDKLKKRCYSISYQSSV